MAGEEGVELGVCVAGVVAVGSEALEEGLVGLSLGKWGREVWTYFCCWTG